VHRETCLAHRQAEEKVANLLLARLDSLDSKVDDLPMKLGRLPRGEA